MQLLRSVGGRSTGVGFACAVVHAPACAREISRRRSEGGCASLLFTCLRIRRNASTEIEHVGPSICTHGHAAGRFVCWAVADGPVRSGVRSLGRTHPTVYAGVRARVPCRAVPCVRWPCRGLLQGHTRVPYPCHVLALSTSLMDRYLISLFLAASLHRQQRMAGPGDGYSPPFGRS